jgi:hypothetical protein
LEAVNEGDSDQVYHVTYSDLTNADRSSNMARMLLSPKNTFEQGAQPGESCWVGKSMPTDPSQPVGYKYRITMTSHRKQSEAFDVHLDEAGKKSHPMPPQSEWNKLRTPQQAMLAGDAKPFEWVLDPATRRPTQVLRAGEEGAAETRIYGDKISEEFGAALNQLIQGGMNPAQAALKLQEQASKDFRAGIDKNTKIVYRASDGTLQERLATPAELVALRKKYSRYMKSP